MAFCYFLKIDVHFVTLKTKPMSITDFFSDWWKSIIIGSSPQIFEKCCITGIPSATKKTAITKTVNNIIDENKKKHYKFGKTGHTLTRTDQDDYRAASYTKLYVLYKSKKETYVESLESYYCKKYKTKKNNDNIDVNSLGKMKTLDGFYFLYLVI